MSQVFIGKMKAVIQRVMQASVTGLNIFEVHLLAYEFLSITDYLFIFFIWCKSAMRHRQSGDCRQTNARVQQAKPTSSRHCSMSI